MNQPLAPGARKEYERKKAVEQNDDEDQADRSLKDFVDAPGLVVEDQKANEESNRCDGELGEHRHGERSAGTGDAQFGFNFLLEDIDVVLKFAGEKFPDFLIDAIDVRDQCQQAEQEKKREGDGEIHAILRDVLACAVLRGFVDGLCAGCVRSCVTRSVRAAGSPSSRRNLASLRAISPLSRSWSKPAR